MKQIEISPSSLGRFDDIAEDMARAYIYDFAREPWNEVSKCINEKCMVDFAGCAVGSLCVECGEVMLDAYDAAELTSNWRDLIEDQDSFMEITLDENDRFLRTTMARPTDPVELARRKYPSDELMAQWIDDNLPSSFVWIEDTFADLRRSPQGNMVDRGRTLARIALRYSGDDIVTRTKVEAIVRATVRDAGYSTDLWIGRSGAGAGFGGQARSTGIVPDQRTVLRVDGGELRR